MLEREQGYKLSKGNWDFLGVNCPPTVQRHRTTACLADTRIPSTPRLLLSNLRLLRSRFKPDSRRQIHPAGECSRWNCMVNLRSREVARPLQDTEEAPPHKRQCSTHKVRELHFSFKSHQQNPRIWAALHYVHVVQNADGVQKPSVSSI